MRHLACIMDGNRRWAKEHNRQPEYGHIEGVQAVKRVIEFCLQENIKYLSLYTFSLENLKRSESEKLYLFELLAHRLQEGAHEFIERGIRVRFIGNWNFFPPSIVPLCTQIEAQTAACNRLHVSFLICYGGQQEIVAAIQKIAAAVSAQTLEIQTLTPELVSTYLWSKELPAPDLIIRTSGNKRLSNFLLFQAAYSELYFLDCLWPDITTDDLQKAVSSFNHAQRNFGT